MLLQLLPILHLWPILLCLKHDGVHDTEYCLQFFELDLPHASAVKQHLVQKALPDTHKVTGVHASCLYAAENADSSLLDWRQNICR